jgi:hypothetical protein
MADILDLIDNAIGDVTWDAGGGDAMRYSPDTRAEEAEVFANAAQVGRMLRDTGAQIMATWGPVAVALTEAFRELVRQLRPMMPVIEAAARHQRRMDMWRRKSHQRPPAGFGGCRPPAVTTDPTSPWYGWVDLGYVDETGPVFRRSVADGADDIWTGLG